jgi:hypothetical protein
MKKLNIIFLSIIIGLIFPLQAFAENVKNLEFNNLESLMNTKNPIILNSNSTFDDTVNARLKGIAGIDILLNQWNVVNTTYGAGDATSPEDQAAIRYLLDVQKSALEGQKASYSSMNIMNTLLNIDKGNNTVIWSMEVLYISYNAISYQLDDIYEKKSLATRQVEIVKLQEKLGMATELQVEEANNNFRSIELAYQSLTNSKKSILQQFNVNLGQDYDSELIIGQVPDISASQISSIDIGKDYESAKNLSYDYRLDANSKDSERKFKNSFYNAYQTILDKQSALEVEVSKMKTAESKWKITQLKYTLGLISKIQYESERSSYLSQNSTTEIAKDTLAQAYRQYGWAKRGLIFSASTPGS